MANLACPAPLRSLTHSGVPLADTALSTSECATVQTFHLAPIGVAIAATATAGAEVRQASRGEANALLWSSQMWTELKLELLPVQKLIWKASTIC